MLAETAHGGTENRQSTWFDIGERCPEGMLQTIDEAFWVGHHTKHSTGRVGQGGHISEAPVGIDGPFARWPGHIAESNSLLIERIHVRNGKLPFGVGNGQEVVASVFKETAVAALAPDRHPAANELSGIVENQAAGIIAVVGNKQAGFGQDLESVTYTEHETVASNEVAQLVSQIVNDLVGENPTSRHIITIAESSGKGKNIVVIDSGRSLDYPVEMDKVTFRPCNSPCADGFQIAVDPGSTNNHYFGFLHLGNSLAQPQRRTPRILHPSDIQADNILAPTSEHHARFSVDPAQFNDVAASDEL